MKFTPDVEALLGLAAKHDAGALVIGLPKNMDGNGGPARPIHPVLRAQTPAKTELPIVFWDERMSTAAVTRTLLEADASRARRAELVDKMAGPTSSRVSSTGSATGEFGSE